MADLDSENHYATAANFGNKVEEPTKRPWVTKVTVPESIKRKYPSKHYVYKVVVKWTNGTETIIYRRYSLFFDFVVKLQELVTKLRKIDPKLEEADLKLPELPSKFLFSRSQTHQVAEKRRRKVEEFCQQLILLPPEISESGLVLGFFNIWPDDTLLRNHSQGLQHVISAPVLVSNPSDSPPPLLKSTNSDSVLNDISSSTSSPSQTSPPPAPPPSSEREQKSTNATTTSCSALDSIIAHPDEMEHLEQYRVLGNYEAKDSHQVDLFTGQVVHVIEKHDTGWWMVMSEDEQGYAPAAYLEPVDGNTRDKDVHPQTITDDEVYEAMEEYSPVSEDEVGFKVHDRIKVLAKSMDGWWKIRSNGRTGFAPAALIRRVQEDNTSFGYESERAIYEELNIHHPPPRRNTLDQTKVNHAPPGYLSPRSNPVLKDLMEENIYCDPAEESPDDMDGEAIYCDPADELSDREEDDHVYKVPRLSSDQPAVPARQGSLSKNSEMNRSGSEVSSRQSPLRGSDSVPPGYDRVRGLSDSVPPGYDRVRGGSDSASHGYERVRGGSDSDPQGYGIIQRGSDKAPRGYNVVRRGSEGISRGSDVVGRRGSSHSQRSKSSSVSPPPQEVDKSPTGSAENIKQEVKVPKKPKVAPKPPLKPKSKSVDTSEHNEYVAMQGPDEAQTTPNRTNLTSKSSIPVAPNHTCEDYEDLDAMGGSQSQLIPALDDYVDMSGASPLEDLKRSDEMAKAKAGVPEPPPRVSNKPTPNKKKIGPTKSFSIDPELPVFEDYIEMEGVTSPPPAENKVTSPPPRNTKAAKPAVPAPYSPKTRGKPSLVRARSMEDLLSSSRDTPDQSKPHSPPLEKKNAFAPPLPARNPPSSKPTDRAQPVERDPSFLPVKPKPGRTRNPFKRNNKQPQLPNSHSNFDPSDAHPTKPRAGKPAPERSISPIARHSISPPGIRERSPHPPLVHTASEPLIDPVQPKRAQFVASFSFGASSDRCLSFSAGDRCELVRKNEETGWWLIKMGEKVGWTPGEYWKELPTSGRDRSVTAAPQPPAPTPPRKPRSHTVADVMPIPESHDLVSSTRGLTSSGEGEMSPLTDSGRHPSSGGKAKAVPPPKPKPLPEAGSPLVSRKPKPIPPQKYGSPSTGRNSPTPPPLPPANATRRLGSHSSVPDAGGAPKVPILPPKPTVQDGSEYLMLNEAIEKAVWFAGKMERIQAESFLMENGRQREFLVRERTTKDGYYALSVRYHYNIRHFNIDPTADGQYCMGMLVFPSIDEIITHYQTNSLFIHDSQHVTLGQPVTKKRGRLADSAKTNGV